MRKPGLYNCLEVYNNEQLLLRFPNSHSSPFYGTSMTALGELTSSRFGHSFGKMCVCTSTFIMILRFGTTETLGQLFITTVNEMCYVTEVHSSLRGLEGSNGVENRGETNLRRTRVRVVDTGNVHWPHNLSLNLFTTIPLFPLHVLYSPIYFLCAQPPLRGLFSFFLRGKCWREFCAQTKTIRAVECTAQLIIIAYCANRGIRLPPAALSFSSFFSLFVLGRLQAARMSGKPWYE